MKRKAYQYARSNYRSLRRDAVLEGRWRGYSPQTDTFLMGFTRRERRAITAERAAPTPRRGRP